MRNVLWVAPAHTSWFRAARRQRAAWVRLGLLCCALWWLAPPAAADSSAGAIAEDDLCKTHITVDDAWIPYCRNERLGEMRGNVTRAILLLHGKLRNARSYFRAVEQVLNDEGRDQDTLLFALQFLTHADIKAHRLPKHTLYYSLDGWKDGHRSVNAPHLSSFDVIDRVLKRLVEQNPNLETIVIAGHSAGAQTAQRHAAGRKQDLEGWKGEIRYVLANAGSYMYLTRERPHEPNAACAKSYHDYRYGTDNNRVEYFSGQSPDTLWNNFSRQRVTLFLGRQDTDPDTDQSCEAAAQGRHRLERGLKFFELTNRHRPPHLTGPSSLRLQIVEGVGHDFARMWDSRCGRALLFGTGSCPRREAPKAAFPLK